MEVVCVIDLCDRSKKIIAVIMFVVANLCIYIKIFSINFFFQSVAFFSSVEVDSCLRKDAYDECVTPSNPAGMEKEYGIPLGVSISISIILQIII